MGFNEFLSSIFGNKSTRDMKEIQPWVEKIKAAYPEVAKLDNDALRAKTEELKAYIHDSAAEQRAKVEELKASVEDTELEKREDLFNQIDKIEKEILEIYEKALDEVLPTAFSIVKETAKRFSENEEIVVTATDFDRQLAATKDFVRIEGDKAIYQNHWIAGGNDTVWNMVHYDVQLFGGVVLHKGKIAEMATGEGTLSLAMTICGSMILGAFTTGEVRRRLTASPRRMVLMGLQRLLTLGGFALVVCVGYLVLSIGLMMAAGLDPLHLSVGGVLMTFGATCVYALMTVACGFMLSEFGLSEEAANGFANIFGLLIMFTSGVALPIDMMPGVMVTIAKFLPGWWYCTAIDNALGFGTAAETGISVAGWSGSLGLVALFGVMFICIGLAAGRFRRSRPALAAPATTQLAE